MTPAQWQSSGPEAGALSSGFLCIFRTNFFTAAPLNQGFLSCAPAREIPAERYDYECPQASPSYLEGCPT